MKNLLKIFLLLIVITLFSTCGSTKTKNVTENYTVADTNLYAWVNLMPGSKPRFHITGDIQLKRYGEVILDSVELLEATVFQNDSGFYRFKPVINETNSKNKDEKFPEVRIIHFSDGRGFEIGPNFNPDQPVKIQFYFSYENKSYIYKSTVVKIEKVY